MLPFILGVVTGGLLLWALLAIYVVNDSEKRFD
jgi:hypothetical protein